MQLAAVCRKFETEKEKILPFGLPPITKVMFEEDEQEESLTQDDDKEKVYQIFIMFY